MLCLANEEESCLEKAAQNTSETHTLHCQQKKLLITHKHYQDSVLSCGHFALYTLVSSK